MLLIPFFICYSLLKRRK